MLYQNIYISIYCYGNYGVDTKKLVRMQKYSRPKSLSPVSVFSDIPLLHLEASKNSLLLSYGCIINIVYNCLNNYFFVVCGGYLLFPSKIGKSITMILHLQMILLKNGNEH